MAILPNIGPRSKDYAAVNAFDFAPVVPSDTVDFGYLTNSLYVGTTGNVVAVTNGGVAVTFIGVPAGTELKIQCRRVNATSTTASNIVALF